MGPIHDKNLNVKPINVQTVVLPQTQPQKKLKYIQQKQVDIEDHNDE